MKVCAAVVSLLLLSAGLAAGLPKLPPALAEKAGKEVQPANFSPLRSSNGGAYFLEAADENQLLLFTLANAKPEVKAETKTEAKIDAKTEVKAETKSEAKAEEKSTSVVGDKTAGAKGPANPPFPNTNFEEVFRGAAEGSSDLVVAYKLKTPAVSFPTHVANKASSYDPNLIFLNLLTSLQNFAKQRAGALPSLEPSNLLLGVKDYSFSFVDSTPVSAGAFVADTGVSTTTTVAAVDKKPVKKEEKVTEVKKDEKVEAKKDEKNEKVEVKKEEKVEVKGDEKKTEVKKEEKKTEVVAAGPHTAISKEQLDQLRKIYADILVSTPADKRSDNAEVKAAYETSYKKQKAALDALAADKFSLDALAAEFKKESEAYAKLLKEKNIVEDRNASQSWLEEFWVWLLVGGVILLALIAVGVFFAFGKKNDDVVVAERKSEQVITIG